MKTLLALTLLSVFSLYAAIPSAPLPKTTGGVVTVVQTNGDKELTWVDEQIQAILPARVGISDGIIGSLGDPMKMKKTLSLSPSGSKLLAPPQLGLSGLILPPKVIEEPLRLQALINKSALINGKWYKVNDSVRLYSLSEIKHNSVLLSGKKNQKLILFLTKQNNNIKITTK